MLWGVAGSNLGHWNFLYSWKSSLSSFLPQVIVTLLLCVCVCDGVFSQWSMIEYSMITFCFLWLKISKKASLILLLYLISENNLVSLSDLWKYEIFLHLLSVRPSFYIWQNYPIRLIFRIMIPIWFGMMLYSENASMVLLRILPIGDWSGDRNLILEVKCIVLNLLMFVCPTVFWVETIKHLSF